MVRTPRQGTLGGDAVNLTVSKVITLGISLVSSMLLSRFRTLTEYGTYSQLLLVINLMTTLFMLGLPNSINYFLARAETQEERRHFLSIYYTLSTILSIIVGIILVLAIPMVEVYFKNNQIRYFYYFLAIYPWAKIIASSVENVLIVYHRVRFLMGYRVLNSFLLLFCILVVWWFEWSFQIYMILFLLTEATFAIAVYVVVSHLSGGLQIRLESKIIKQILKFSIPIGLASMVGTLNIELDKLMIGNFLNTEQMAIYTNAAKEMPVTIIATSLTAVLLPQMARLIKKGDNKGAVSIWGDATIISFSLICFFAAGLFVFAPQAITVLYSEKYLPGTDVFRCYNIVLLFRCTYFGMVLNSKGKTRFILYSSIASLVINIVFNYVFYSFFGFVGPAISTVMAVGVMSFAQIFMTGRIMRLKISQVFPWKTLGKILMLNILFAIGFYYLQSCLALEQIMGDVCEAILLGCVWGLFYAIVLWKPLKRYWKRLNQGGR